MKTQKYPTAQARNVVLLGVFFLATNFVPSSDPLNTEVHVPQKTIERIHQNREDKRHELRQKDVAWQKIVTKVAEAARITNRNLAERVAQALEDASYESNVSPWLMASLIRVESSGNPNAVSSAGAIGLTQILPSTGRQIARELGLRDYTTQNLYNPEINVRMGTYYVRYLLNQFSGDKRAAIAAYNWGPGTIAKRLENNESLPVKYANKVLGRSEEQGS